jgi:hypothetical protein
VVAIADCLIERRQFVGMRRDRVGAAGAASQRRLAVFELLCWLKEALLAMGVTALWSA